MKLSEYAKKNSIHYRTAFIHWQKGFIKGKQLPSGTIVVFDEPVDKQQRVAVYARVSSSADKDNLERQIIRLTTYANAKGYSVTQVVKEIGSGLNDHRPKLEKLFKDTSITTILVEHPDRLCRFGMNYINVLMESQGRKIECINPVIDEKNELIGDFVSIITSFCARIYGQRRNKKRTEELIQQLAKTEDE